MIKRKSLQTGTHYSNSVGETAFVGSRLEGALRVSTFKIDIPIQDITDTCAPCGAQYASMTVKTAVPDSLSPTDYTAAMTLALNYIKAEIIGDDVTKVLDLAAGPIEWTIEDL